MVLLALAVFISFIWVGTIEGISITVVLVINATIGFITESRAVESMESLREMTKVKTHVKRNGEVKEIHAENLVPGDIVVLQPGDMVPADLRIIESSKLQVDESTLTGESTTISKSSKKVKEDKILAERTSMLYKGTHLTQGTSEGVVTSTGTNTELGKISESTSKAPPSFLPWM